MTSVEDSQVRVAKAQEAREELHAEIMKKYGSQADLDMHCKGDTYSKKGGPRDLRRRFGAATKELRLAKSDLARMRNEEQQKPKGYEIGIREDKDGITLTDVPDELVGELTGGTGKVLGPTEDGKGMIIELAPDRPGDANAMDDAEEGKVTISVNGGPAYQMDSLEAKKELERSVKRSLQLDLEGKKAKTPLSGRIKVPPERFELETPSWTLKGPKEAMLELVRSEQRAAVKGRVQKGLRAKKDAIINDGDFDLAVERFTDEIMRGIIHRLPEDE